MSAEDDYNYIHKQTWVRRTTGLLGGATLGGMYGAAIGAVAACLPYIFGAMNIAGAAPVLFSAALAAVPASAALFSCFGAAIGLAIGADVGSNSGSDAASTEIERQRGRVAGNDPEISLSASKGSGMYIWKAALVLIPLFAAAGALMALSPVTTTAIALLGFKGAVAATAAIPATATTAAVAAHGFIAATPAAIAASATIFGMFGALMPIKNSIIHNKISNFYQRLLTDNKTKVEVHVTEPARQQVRMSDMQVMDEPERALSFAQKEQHFSLQNILDKSEEHPSTVLLR